MRIVVVVSYYKPAFVYGGPARSIPAMCEALAGLGAQVTVFTTNADGSERLNVPLSRPVDVDGVSVWYFPLNFHGYFFYSRELAAVCRGELGKFDLAVLDFMWGHALGPAALACRQAGVPYVVPLRSQLQPWAMRQKFWKKWPYYLFFSRRYLKGAAAFHCTDESEAQSLKRLGLKVPCFVVPNALDVTRFVRLPERGALRSRWQIPPQALVMLFLGRLKRLKRPDIAVATLAALGSPAREVHLIVAGPDEDRLTAALRSQAQATGCADRLHFAGLLQGDEVLNALADADLFLMPSAVQENFGMAAAESLAAGVPILVSNAVPVGRWAEAAEAGKVVPGTAAAFREASLELLSDPERLRAMGEKGRVLAKAQFDLPVVARKLWAQYEAILTTGRPLPPFPTPSESAGKE